MFGQVCEGRKEADDFRCLDIALHYEKAVGDFQSRGSLLGNYSFVRVAGRTSFFLFLSVGGSRSL